ncbi:GNAT family N-acetyltransferase [Oceanirhabdus sp. W0125-5]|uniref:GNAT family N-acetyltransferase n=1 Tax=Oceanirhabdus sp. W0125-5 TaxID=2999116 RepID=UPI0022F30371|nr:GNAT family N-acetyltransferase [Oceanirhabdus sp. W0125-5]WBW96495.1 GNAT family N-acetyltransferase [Oceanirhabdus sp. W0125-5]
MNLIFKEVTKENWEECIDLKVSKGQEDFVAPNSYSLLEANYEEELYPLCIYDGQTMVGFLMYGKDEETDNLWMCRLMIDDKYQKRGYGKAAVVKLLDVVREKYGNIELYTSFEPENIVADKLYRSVGFKKTGEIMWEELVAKIDL